MKFDPLNLSAASLLIQVYRQNGEAAKVDDLSAKLTKMVENKSDGAVSNR
jgi:hypothetical protein